MARVDINGNVMRIRNECDPLSDTMPAMPAQDLYNMIQDALSKSGVYPTEVHIVDPITLTGSAEGLFSYLPRTRTISGLDNLNLHNVTSVRGMFLNDTHLSELFGDIVDMEHIDPLELSDGAYTDPSQVLDLSDTPHLTDMSYMFYGCASLHEVNIVGDERSWIETTKGMFQGCKSLERVNIGNIDTYEVTDMSRMFKGCEHITSLKMNWRTAWTDVGDVGSVRNLSEMFDGCRRLRFLDASNTIWPDVSTTNHRDMFRGCVSLNEVRLSPSLQPLLAAHDLTSETLAARKEAMETATRREGERGDVLVIGNPDATIEIDASVLADIIADRRDEGRTQGQPDIREVHVVGNVSLEGDASGLFSWLEHAKTIDGLELLDTSRVTSMSRMFRCCHNLRTVDVSCLDTSKVTNMSDMFDSCPRLEEIRLDGIDTHAVTNMNGMFAGCRTLQSLDVSQLDMSNVKSAVGMFAGCSSLTNLDISGWQTPNLTDMRYMFSSCDSLRELKTDKMSAGIAGYTITDSMFEFCEGLTTLDLSGFGITEQDLDSSSDMFRGCVSLEDITVLKSPKPTYNVASRTPIAVGDDFADDESAEWTNQLG